MVSRESYTGHIGFLGLDKAHRAYRLSIRTDASLLVALGHFGFKVSGLMGYKGSIIMALRTNRVGGIIYYHNYIGEHKGTALAFSQASPFKSQENFRCLVFGVKGFGGSTVQGLMTEVLVGLGV